MTETLHMCRVLVEKCKAARWLCSGRSSVAEHGGSSQVTPSELTGFTFLCFCLMTSNMPLLLAAKTRCNYSRILDHMFT